MTELVEDARCKYMHGQPTLTVERQFRLLLRLLRRDFPPEHPIRVRRVVLPTTGREAYQGQCGLSNQDKPKSERYFTIWLRKSDPWATQRDALLHEWAHALTWYQLAEGKDHGDVFARKQGVLYRAYIED